MFCYKCHNVISDGLLKIFLFINGLYASYFSFIFGLFKQTHNTILGSGCSSVDRAVASDTRGLRLKSRHWQLYYRRKKDKDIRKREEKTIQLLQTYVQNVHPVFSAGISTLEYESSPKTSLVPLPLDHPFKKLLATTPSTYTRYTT